MPVNRTVRLKQRPSGPITSEIFQFRDEPIAEPGDGEFRVRIEYVSLDPAMRGWMSEGKSYVKPVALGDVMRAYSAGRVEASRHPDHKEGDAVVGLFGAQTHAISNGKGVTRADLGIAHMPSWLGGLGMPGLTAYFGLLEVAQPKSGETVVVSAASGAVGQVVGQLAKLQGCRTVGIAGGPKKCNFITSEIGYDAAVDYKTGRLAEDLKSACPDGIDVDFENVGGDIFDTVLAQMNPFGRVAVCGMMSIYGASEPPPGPKNMRNSCTPSPTGWQSPNCPSDNRRSRFRMRNRPSRSRSFFSHRTKSSDCSNEKPCPLYRTCPMLSRPWLIA